MFKKGGSISAKGGPYLLGDLDRGSISTRRFGPGGPNLLGGGGVQIRCDTGTHAPNLRMKIVNISFQNCSII